MATVNTASLRSEFDALKARFEALCADGAMSAESRALVEALLTLFQVLMAVFMEKNTPKGSRTSGLPSSRTEPDETARTRPDTPFTNTRAERNIRMAKVKHTVSGCFRTLRHAQAHCRISSYLQSMAHQGYNPLTAIQIALNGTAATMIKQEKGRVVTT